MKNVSNFRLVVVFLGLTTLIGAIGHILLPILDALIPDSLTTLTSSTAIALAAVLARSDAKTTGD